MKNAMSFTKGERVAIIILASMIFLILLANFFVIKYPVNVKNNLHDLDSILAVHENAVNEMKNKQLAEQIEREQRYEKIKQERKKNTYHKAQKPSFKKTDEIKPKADVKPIIPVLDINKADSLEFQQLPEIGSFFARNMVEYRDKLGGYVELSQILEVYGFDSLRFNVISPYIKLDTVALRKVRVNYDDFKTILKHPYIEYEDVKKIINHREKRGMITNWEMYLDVVNREADDRLRYYLEW